MIKGDITLEGERVGLLPASHEHLDGLSNVSAYSEICTYTNRPSDLVTTINQWVEAKQQGSRYTFVIFDKDSNEIVGSTSYLNISVPDRKLEIGATWLAPKVWRTRVNSECKYLLLRFAFEELDVVRVQLRTDSKNERSNRAIQRIGATFEGTLRQEMIMDDGYIRDSNVYSILDKEWDAVENRLLSCLK